MANDFYVYLLVDHDPAQPAEDKIFYVGKGKDRRALQHWDDALNAANSKRDPNVETSIREALAGMDSVEEDAPAELSAKITRIQDILAEGRKVRVDVLRAELAESTAYVVESAVIEAIGLRNLTNAMHGHTHQRMAVTVFEKLARADVVAVDEPAIVVPVKGVRGSGDPITGLLSADHDLVWENARTSWSIGKRNVAKIKAMAAAGSPALLFAVDAGGGKRAGIALLVAEIADVEPVPNSRLWQFIAAGPGVRSAALSAKYLGHRLHDLRAQPGLRYSPAFKEWAEPRD